MDPQAIYCDPGTGLGAARGSLSVSTGLKGGREPTAQRSQEAPPDKLLLNDFRPRSMFKIPKTEIVKAKFPIFDAHHHAQARTAAAVDEQLKLMDTVGVERTVVFSGSGAQFDENRKLYSSHPSRFDLWCGLDSRGATEPGYGPAAVKELRRCHEMGAVGLGEIVDKGRGFGVREVTAPVSPGPSRRRPASGSHLRDVRRIGHAREHPCFRPDLGL